MQPVHHIIELQGLDSTPHFMSGDKGTVLNWQERARTKFLPCHFAIVSQALIDLEAPLPAVNLSVSPLAAHSPERR